ncbi:MAG: dienelactone hydrolase family protein [Phycisphaerae bacterium]|nr:dienelactone hydrolase family protein [Phycisphaerae bacterium]
MPALAIDVGALLLRPAGARWLLVLAHGAGAGMRHPFMETLSAALAEAKIATLRYQFPYMERGQRRPDPPATLVAAGRAAVAEAHRLAPDLPLLAGGKSLGGRITSQAAAAGDSAEAYRVVRGLVFFGFPLHAAGRPSVSRAAHLNDVAQPLLFLQGTRDALADLSLIRSVCAALGERATLHVVDGADHGFAVLKRSGRTADQVFGELAQSVRHWVDRLS